MSHHATIVNPPAADPRRSTAAVLRDVKEAGEDFEWYPTTEAMVAVVAGRMGTRTASILDIGAGDGRVLVQLAAACDGEPELFAIEKSETLMKAQPEAVVPVGTHFEAQNLVCLPAEVIFCNPPYSAFETWAAEVIRSGHARVAYLVIPRRWSDSAAIAAAIEHRKAVVKVIGQSDFHDAERRARAVVDIVEVRFPALGGGGSEALADPFNDWFDANVDTFDHAEAIKEPTTEELARQYGDADIPDMVAGYDAEYARMAENYQAIFRLDYAILKELGVDKKAVRAGLRERMAGLKSKYWELLFNRLGALTRRFSARSRTAFLDRIAKRQTVEFTAGNARAVVIWAVKHANLYYDQQVIDLFRDLSTFEAASNYKSNVKTWESNGWRYNSDDHSHYKLDYRIVVRRYSTFSAETWRSYDYPGGLNKTCHDLVGDILAVFGNFGFTIDTPPSLSRAWAPGQWQDFRLRDGSVLVQVKAFKNGNLHMRFKPDAIRQLNVEAGRLLGWLQSPNHAAEETGCTAAEAARWFGKSLRIEATSLRLLTAG